MELGPIITTVVAAEGSQNEEKGNENFTWKQWLGIAIGGLSLSGILLYVLNAFAFSH